MSRRSRLAGQVAMLALVGSLVVAFPAGFALAQDLADPGATTQSNHTLVPIINLTSTPTETPTATATQTATPTPTPTATPTPTSGGGGDGGDSDTEADGQRLVVDKDSGPAGGVTSEEDCSNANYTSIQRAVDDAAPGDTVVVCAGDGQYQPTNTIEIETSHITLRAEGDAEITTTEQTAIRTTAAGVTIRGFTFDHTVMQSQRYTIEVGARNTVVRNNSFELTGNSSGILLSDGLEPETGEPDPSLRAATGSHVVKNVINTSKATPYGIFTDADATLIKDNTLFPHGKCLFTIKSSGNHTIIKGNKIDGGSSAREYLRAQADRADGGGGGCGYDKGILIGGGNDAYRGGSQSLCNNPAPNAKIFRPPGHTWAQNNRFVDNYIVGTAGSVRVAARGNWSKVLTALEGFVMKNNTIRNSSGVGIQSNTALIKNNNMSIDATGPRDSPRRGMGQSALCYLGNSSNITGNYLVGYGGGLSLAGSTNTISNNIIMNNSGGLNVKQPLAGRDYGYQKEPAWHAKGNRILNNALVENGPQAPIRVKVSVAEVAYNNITNNPGYSYFNGGIKVNEGGEILNLHHNIIRNNSYAGIKLAGNVTRLHHNTILRNDGSGVILGDTSDSTYHISEFHHNLIDNNGGLGINRQNSDKTDDHWPILNATHNIWGCGGPSGGLRDPYTNRTANGTGDGLSAGDDIGYSNIHFDPFFVREDVTCTTGRSNPTPTPTPPTPTKTPTPTPTPTPDPPAPVSGNGSGTGGSGGNGTGGSGGSGTGGSGGSGTDGSGSGTGNTGSTGTPSEDTAGKPPTAAPPPATATPSPTATHTPTISPTPQVEPGFGVLTWLLGTTVLIALLMRRRLLPAMEDAND